MSDIAKPSVTYGAGRNTFEWAEYNLSVVADRITDDGKAELYFWYNNGNGRVLLHMGQANLLSSTMHRDFIKSLSTRGLEIDWQTILTYVTKDTMQHLREGENVIWLSEDYGKSRPSYILPPLFVKDAPNIVYADRSSAKSLFITMVDLALTLPWYDNPIELQTGSESQKVLYCDWESSAQMLGWQKECLRRGIPDAPWCDVPYLHCSGSLYDNVHQIQDKIEATKASIIVIDSLGMAVGDDLNLTKPAFAFFAALRQLPVTPIIIGHTAKDKEARRKTVYGNAYYENEARSVWEIVKQQEPMSNELTITLFHRKPPPFSFVHEPLAFKFIFNDDIITVHKGEPIRDKSSSEDTVSVPEVVLSIISESKTPLSPLRIAEISGMEQNNIRQAIYRLKNLKPPKIKQIGDGYAVI